MGTYHTVEEGEHIMRIALAYGWTQWKTIWNAPENAELRQTRDSPDVLMPGDSLYVPDRDTKETPAATEQRHKYKLKVPPLKLRLNLQDRFYGSIADQDCS